MDGILAYRRRIIFGNGLEVKLWTSRKCNTSFTCFLFTWSRLKVPGIHEFPTWYTAVSVTMTIISSFWPWPWPVTVTPQPIRLSANFMTLIPSLTFTELQVVSLEHSQRVLNMGFKFILRLLTPHLNYIQMRIGRCQNAGLTMGAIFERCNHFGMTTVRVFC